ncbi:MAG: glycine oxidase ThiO [Blastocatellia bacterium]|nr:glycine oxidase ThiO [Blastocatellia bacterium]
MTPAVGQFDAIIIGGGVIGCSIAWRLSQAGMRALVVERGAIGREASWAAGGILSPLAEADRADAFFDLCAASRSLYAEFAHELREATGIDIEYRSEGTIYLALTDDDEEELEIRLRWQQQAGLNVKRLNATCVHKLEPMVNERLRWALKFPDDHQVDNRRLTKALEVAARKAGASFLTHTEVISLSLDGRQVRGVLTSRGEIHAKAVIVAAGSWSSLIKADRGEESYFSIEPIRGQMVAIDMAERPLQHILYSRRAYLVPRNSGYVIAGSTVEEVGYDKRVTAGGIGSIISRALEIAPGLAKQAILETWAGLRPKVRSADIHDEWPVLGVDAQIGGLVYATGHYRNGILLTPITAKTISELILRGQPALDITPFSSLRFQPAQRVKQPD